MTVPPTLLPADVTPPSGLILIILCIVPALGLVTRAFNRIIPSNGSQQQDRTIGIKYAAFVPVRLAMLAAMDTTVLRPSTTGLICTVYEMGTYELNSLGYLHHLSVLIGGMFMFTQYQHIGMFTYANYVYRFGTLLNTVVLASIVFLKLAPQGVDSLVLKKKILSYCIVHSKFGLFCANVGILFFFITNFSRLHIFVRLMIPFIVLAFLPEQRHTDHALHSWARKLSGQIKSHVPFAASATALAVEVQRRATKVFTDASEFGLQMRYRFSPVETRMPLERLRVPRQPSSPAMSPVNSAFSPMTPAHFLDDLSYLSEGMVPYSEGRDSLSLAAEREHLRKSEDTLAAETVKDGRGYRRAGSRSSSIGRQPSKSALERQSSFSKDDDFATALQALKDGREYLHQGSPKSSPRSSVGRRPSKNVVEREQSDDVLLPAVQALKEGQEIHQRLGRGSGGRRPSKGTGAGQ
ncbi:uncharacterized protein EV422DRAFT_601717 [Fimicolochytrium jonesii]|uniref:uncharacterized protein n=1 Tax=Fimicolochytrium jonesii TaxID=1396493 RepID=UPI0022FDD6E0|nr:uncharacterized protein EV422DRAFT_601717 [Fimicolochytrium jonesii]KAI8818831.1 hypothetical protein EV422DRAFT_601717 [Fimicolochytrium jonesii]